MENNKVSPEDSIETLNKAQKGYESLCRKYLHQWESGHKFNQRDVGYYCDECEKIENCISNSPGDWKQDDKKEALDRLRRWRFQKLRLLESYSIIIDSKDSPVVAVQNARQDMDTLFDYPSDVIAHLLKVQQDYNEKKYYSC